MTQTKIHIPMTDYSSNWKHVNFHLKQTRKNSQIEKSNFA